MDKTLWAAILDFCFPRRCLSCHTLGSYLCSACLAARVLEDTEAAGYYALVRYRDPVIRRAIWLLKYGGIRELGETFGRAAAEALLPELAEWAEWRAVPAPLLVVPIPLSPRRLRERGYNQTALIARGFAAAAGPDVVCLEHALSKIKETPTQVSVRDRTHRLSNLAEAFVVVTPDIITHQEILLIDDVITTGATLTEAKRTLIRAGARTVHCLAIAES